MKLLMILLLMEGAAAQQRGLFPAILNLASNADISSNATCGDPAPEVYCKLVEHVPGRRIKPHRGPLTPTHCPKCDATSSLAKERHPITNAIDGTNEWWQSPSIKNGRQFHWVTITLDLKQIFQVAYIIIKAANSPRPGNWILERSLDGLSFAPWQFYAISDSECLSHYNVTPRLGPPTYRRDQEVICTSYYSRLNPLEHGEIHTSLINGRPGADDLTPDLLSFTSARFIRLRLQRIRTLNADLMTLSNRDPREIDPIVTRRYFYSIKDVSVGGMCICYGHAQSCPLDPVTKRLQCVCEHDTCGESCNECCPGYHQQPWQPGTVSEGNKCEKCNCHNKAVDCFYNQTVSDQSGSLNLHGVRRGGGVCVSCSQNTAGVNCEHCSPGFYRPKEVSPYSDFPCVECDCDLRGSESTECTRDDTQPGAVPGQCVCREGFTGQQCDRCAFGFRDFPLCSRCECNLSGSTNTDPCEACSCKVNVMGAHCDLCRPGFFNLQRGDRQGCTDCFCFGVSDVCESSDWKRDQVVYSNAWLFASPSVNTNPVVPDNDLPTHNASGHAHIMMSWDATDSFLGNKLSSYGGFLNYSVVYDVPLDNEDHSLPAHSDVIIKGNGRALLAPPLLLSLSPLAERSVSVAMSPWRYLDVLTGRPVTRDDLLSVLADVTSLRVRVHLNTTADGPIRLLSVSLDIADSVSVSGVEAVAVETCECPWGYSGTSCEACLPGFYRVGGVLFGGNCFPCECNDHASECDANGVCVACSHNTTGPHCDQCLPGFYGEPAVGTATDCQQCACPMTSQSFSATCHMTNSHMDMTSQGQLICDGCFPGYTGLSCERCAAGYHGNPQEVGGACVRCECHGNAERCDIVTGECLGCRGNSAGRQCEVCEAGYYGDAVHAKNCQDCRCDVTGAVATVCDVTTGQCLCRENVTGRNCNECKAGFFGLQTGRGCEACGCSESGSSSESCDARGRCQCVGGVAGDRCDRCSRGYYGFNASGCNECTCAHTGGNCDALSGACVCAPHTHGEKCEKCEPEYWGHDAETGCKPCGCSASGSSSPQCESTNGSCPCSLGFSGRSCDRCAPGHHGYPACSPCGCDAAGTDEAFCNATGAVCDCLHTGECVCKPGVSGRACSECLSGSFSLSRLNPSGCSTCFCSGVSEECEERGGMTRSALSLPPGPGLSVVSVSSLQRVVTGLYQQGAETLLDTRALNSSRLYGPLYWRLPALYEGRQLLSYGGVLSYIVTFHSEFGSGSANQEPQILLRGGAMRRLVIYTDRPAPSNGVRTQHDVSMTEHRWRYFNSVSEKPVSRSDFMSVISDIEYVLIKASYGTGLQQSRISNITMETAVEAESDDGGVARQIESCVCPHGYTGSSCQSCSSGFSRLPLSELSSQNRKLLFVRPCVPCRCSNHSESCDPDTGACQDCLHHTAGPACELCAPGHYGSVKGAESDCSLCACPLLDNSFSPTCELDEAFGDFRCTACETGYEGRYCERCAVGYYGNPSLPGGVCVRCSCSVWGAMTTLCDAHTGQCVCKAGVRGQTCDMCQDRHIEVEGQCVSCDDECAGVLLDDLDLIHDNFLSVNISAVTMAPYRQLVTAVNQTRDLKVSLSEGLSVSGLEDDLSQLTNDLTTLLQQVTRVSVAGQEVGVSANDSVTQGALLLERITSLQDKMQELQREAGLVNETKQTDVSSANHTALMQEVDAILESMRRLNVTTANSTARQELSQSESLLRLLQNDFLFVADRLRPLSANITVAMETLQQAHTHLSDAAQRNTHTHTLLDNAHTLMQRYQALHSNLSLECAFADSLTEDSQLMMDDIITEMEHINNNTAQVESYSDALSQWRPLLKEHVDGLVVGLRRTDALEAVYRTESHAQLLTEQAGYLQSSLSSVCNSSLNESSRLAQLDDDITGRVAMAQQDASIAHTASSLALNLTDQSDRPLQEEGGAKLKQSSAVLEDGRRIRNQAEELQVNVSMVTTRLGLVRERVRNSSHLLQQPIRALQAIATASRLQTVTSSFGLRAALEKLQTLGQKLQDSSSVVEQTRRSVTETNKLVTHTHNAANEVQRKLQEAELRTDQLMQRVAPLSILGETLNRNLSEIRELIDQARRQAASIKVAVQVDGDCVRSYRPEVQSSHFSSVTLTMKTHRGDNQLFSLGSNTTVDFLALQMHAGKVSLLWDLGSGSNSLQFPLNVNNNQWTRVNVTRFGGVASLSVHQLESDSAPLPPVTATSPGPSRVLDIDRNTVIHVGGTKTPSSLGPALFSGCLGDASLNERNIGLWNYERREGTCSGCFSSPQSEETSFHFDGSGFSLVHKSLRSTSTSVVLLFKTLSPGGLLLYLASNNTRDFLSLELVGGRVRLTFDLGSGALTLNSEKRYNTGDWFKVTLQRSKRKGYLSIMAAGLSLEKEVLEAESPGSSSDLNRSDRDPIYIGGLPASRPIRRQVVSRSYVGCIKNVEIARSNFDLLRESFGVRKGCVLEAVRSVSLLAGGFVQVADRMMSQEAELMLSFTTNNQSGIVLAALSNDRTHRQFLSLHLVSGVLEAEFGEVGGASRTVAVVKQDGGFSDGSKHSVIVSIHRKSMSLQADELQLKSLSPGGLPRLGPFSLFIGGLPSTEETHLPIRLQNLSRSFRGCIQDVVVGRELIDLSEAVRYEGAELDSCSLVEIGKGAWLSEDQEVQPTPGAPPTYLSAMTPGSNTCVSWAESSLLPSAVQFGHKHSHMTFTINPSTVKRSVSLKLSIRTRASKGTLLLLSDFRQNDYVIVRVRGGGVTMSTDLGKGHAHITSSLRINDGEWHTVVAEVSRRSLSLSVDGSLPESAPLRGNQLDVSNTLYLGGLPHAHSTRRINESSSFSGCVRSVSLNGAILDLTSPTSQHDVTSCFSSDQTGSHFNGSGYAVMIPDGYKVGSDLSVSLEFRTSESDGVLLGISSAKVDAIGLELVNGQVVFNVNNGAGRVTVRSSGRLLCDGLWHRVVAQKSKHSLTLTVDRASASTPNPYPQSTSAETNNPVYLGGYPVEVRQNSLSVRSRFRGCLRSVQLVKSHQVESLNVGHAHFLSGVNPNTCPAA